LDSALAHIVWRRPSCSGWQLLSKRSRSPVIDRRQEEGNYRRVKRESSSVQHEQLHCMLHTLHEYPPPCPCMHTYSGNTALITTCPRAAV
jgi:hypothetical protein